MLVSEYIEQLKKFAEEHGDLEVETYGFNDERITARTPRLAYKKILKGRESKPRFAYFSEEKGDPVCGI